MILAEENLNLNKIDKLEAWKVAFAKAFKSMPLDRIVNKKAEVKFTSYTKDKVNMYLDNPEKYEKDLRKVVSQLCITSPQFNMLVEYIPNIAIPTYTIYPILDKLDNVNVKKIQKDFIKSATYTENLNISSEILKALRINFRYDVLYGYEINTNEGFYIKPLNPDYCKIRGWDEYGCYTFVFDFNYFKGKEDLLDTSYPDEFKKKYNIYKNKGKDYQWQEIDSTTSICTKYFEENLDYCTPPYIGLFSDLYDIEEYKALNKAKVESDNYKLIALQVPLNQKSDKVDDFLLSMDAIEIFNDLLAQQIPDGVGFFATPMSPSEMSFKSNTVSEKNEVENAVHNLFNKTGYSPVLFGEAQNSGSLSYSVKVDEAKLSKLEGQYNRWLNKKMALNCKTFGSDFKIYTKYSIKEEREILLKCAEYGVPVKTQLASIMGLTPLKMIGYSLLENDVLDLSSRFIPLNSTHTQSGSNISDKGRSKKSDGELGEAGQQTRDDGGNDNKGGE